MSELSPQASLVFMKNAIASGSAKYIVLNKQQDKEPSFLEYHVETPAVSERQRILDEEIQKTIAELLLQYPDKDAAFVSETPYIETEDFSVEQENPVIEVETPVAKAIELVQETETAIPVIETAESVAEIAKPVTETVEPVTEASESVTEVVEPITEAVEPVAEVSESVVEAATPFVEIVEPAQKTESVVQETPVVQEPPVKIVEPIFSQEPAETATPVQTSVIPVQAQLSTRIFVLSDSFKELQTEEDEEKANIFILDYPFSDSSKKLMQAKDKVVLVVLSHDIPEDEYINLLNNGTNFIDPSWSSDKVMNIIKLLQRRLNGQR
jgi:hypothetical protein